MRAKTTVHLKDGKDITFEGDMWSKAWPNMLVINSPTRTDAQGRPLLVGQFVDDWSGFSVEYFE